MTDRPLFPELFEQPFRPVDDDDWNLLDARAQQLFRPAAPIDSADLFAGRIDQLKLLVDVIYQAGAHAILYGERGVGKTSLANIIKDKLMGEYKITQVIKISCDPEDTFTSIWGKVFFGIGLDGHMAADIVHQSPQPFMVYRVAEELSRGRPHLVILDEFDRVRDRNTRVLIADTIKYLSDNPIPFKVVVVGVGDSVVHLFGTHPSIARCCTQIKMPRMSAAELQKILDDRYGHIHMAITDGAKALMIHFAHGLPGYMHLLGQLAARAAIAERTQLINDNHVGSALRMAVEKSDESTRRDYLLATNSSAKDNLYKAVLLACATAQKNEIGQFSAADLREPLAGILKREVDIPYYARHLRAFCEFDRGPALIKTGSPKRYRYHFANPLLEPLAVMMGFRDGLLKS
jgi:Cdc6-like AAA superfamily ATPase